MRQGVVAEDRGHVRLGLLLCVLLLLRRLCFEAEFGERLFQQLGCQLFLHALSSRASFGAALVASARYQVSSAVLRCVLCNVSERRSYTRAIGM